MSQLGKGCRRWCRHDTGKKRTAQQRAVWRQGGAAVLHQMTGTAAQLLLTGFRPYRADAPPSAGAVEREAQRRFGAVSPYSYKHQPLSLQEREQRLHHGIPAASLLHLVFQNIVLDVVPRIDQGDKLLAVLPVFLLIVLNLINPDYVSIFFADLTGKIMLGVAALWELLGFLVIRKILNVKY